MPSHDEELLAGTAIACGDTVLVPVLRLRARGLGPFASIEAELVGVLSSDGSAAAFLATVQDPEETVSWSAWLDARPELLVEIRARLGAARQNG